MGGGESIQFPALVHLYSILDEYVQFGKERKGSDHGLFSGSEGNKVNQSKNYEIQNHDNPNKKQKC